MKKIKELNLMFLIMFKIGLFTFGGGYSMVAIIESELVDKKRWITKEEFLNIIAIAESSPGPLAVNSATYVGYKIAGFWGSLFCTLGVVMPSFCIIFAISFFYEKFLSLKYVGYAFMGIKVCVAYLITMAGIKMLKSLNKNIFAIVLTILTIVAMLALNFISKNISSIYYILIGGLVGVFAYIYLQIKGKNQEKNNANDNRNSSSQLENLNGENTSLKSIDFENSIDKENHQSNVYDKVKKQPPNNKRTKGEVEK